MLHVMLTGQGQQSRSPKGLCGAPVAGLYFSKIAGDGVGRRHLCPSCRALALKAAAPGRELTCSVGATSA
jgi:hypothetical protein